MVLGTPALAERSMEKGGRNVTLLPLHRFEINSPLDRQAALAATGEHTEPHQWIRIGWNEDKEDRFEGQLVERHFHIRRITRRRDDMNPVIQGEIDLGATGSVVKVQMRPTLNAIGFLALAPVMSAIMLTSPSDTDVKVFAVLLPIAAYIFIVGPFWYNAAKQERLLRIIFRDE